MRILVIDVGGTHVKVLATGCAKWADLFVTYLLMWGKPW
jgi:uncharacterized hydantoinase/oxoprolinase family protein